MTKSIIPFILFFGLLVASVQAYEMFMRSEQPDHVPGISKVPVEKKVYPASPDTIRTLTIFNTQYQTRGTITFYEKQNRKGSYDVEFTTAEGTLVRGQNISSFFIKSEPLLK